MEGGGEAGKVVEGGGDNGRSAGEERHLSTTLTDDLTKAEGKAMLRKRLGRA